MKEPLKDPSYHSTSCRCYWIMGEGEFYNKGLGGIIILVIIIIITILTMIITIIIALLEDGCEFKSPRK